MILIELYIIAIIFNMLSLFLYYLLFRKSYYETLKNDVDRSIVIVSLFVPFVFTAGFITVLVNNLLVFIIKKIKNGRQF